MLTLAAIAPSVALAACGDGVVDPGERCDHGARNGVDGCCRNDCTLVDLDVDGMCDQTDTCNNTQVFRLTETKLRITGLRTPGADDRLLITGIATVTVPPALDPSASGVRFTLSSAPLYGLQEGTMILDATLPAGGRWMARGADTWTYRDPAGTAGGITKATIQVRPPLWPRDTLVDVAFRFEGRHGRYSVTPGMITFDTSTSLPTENALLGQVIFDSGADSTNRRCAARLWSSPLSRHEATCTFSGAGNRVACQGPPPVGPCHIGDPTNLEVCDLMHAVRAEEAYQETHGIYFAGLCSGLPGFTPSPGVGCLASVQNGGFLIRTGASSEWLTTCSWDSTAEPHFGCEP